MAGPAPVDTHRPRSTPRGASRADLSATTYAQEHALERGWNLAEAPARGVGDRVDEAGAAISVVGSPTDFAPNGPAASSFSTMRPVMGGTSIAVGSGIRQN